MSHAFYYKGDHHRALHWFDSALALQQQESDLIYNMATTMSNKGVVFMANGQWHRALTVFHKATNILV